MVAEGSPRNDSGWLSDPAVGAGFAAAYDGDPWQDAAHGSADDKTVSVVPAQLAPDPAPRLAPGPLVRPRLRGDPPPSRPRAARRPPGRALAGAAVSVAGVLLGIGSLFWVAGEPAQTGRVQTDPSAAVAAGIEPVPTAPLVRTAQPVPAEAETPPPDSAVPAPAPAPAPAPVVPVTVLNNSERDGLADRAARSFEREGWPVQATGNFRGRIPVTTVYYDPGLEASARAFAERFPGMVRVRPRFSTLPARGVVVVLTREYAA